MTEQVEEWGRVFGEWRKDSDEELFVLEEGK
jgi:hypothetical protein